MNNNMFLRDSAGRILFKHGNEIRTEYDMIDAG